MMSSYHKIIVLLKTQLLIITKARKKKRERERQRERESEKENGTFTDQTTERKR